MDMTQQIGQGVECDVYDIGDVLYVVQSLLEMLYILDI